MKKVLIITYYWPPAGGPGVQRWLKFVKYLPDFEIEPIVYIPENPTYPIIDPALEKEVHPDTKIIKGKISEPYRWASLFSSKSTKNISSGLIPEKKKESFIEKALLYIRGNFFIPDARISWVKPSAKRLENYIQQNNIDTIITTGPPHSVHLIGLELKKKLNVRWFADFRDPWTNIGYHKSLKLTPKNTAKHKQLEQDVLQTADDIIVTSPTTKKEFELITEKPIHVITNGYDVSTIDMPPLDEKFTLAHIGSFLSERNPRVLWKALKELILENEDFAKDFELKLIGKVSPTILNTLEEFKLTKNTTFVGYVSHNEAQKAQRAAQVLLLVEIDSYETIGIIPGKLFEYMAAERPIIAIGPEGADFKNILIQTNTGSFFTYEDKDLIKDKILEFYTQYQSKNLKVHAIGLQYFSRKKLTEKLAVLLKK